jgi:AAA-like domain
METRVESKIPAERDDAGKVFWVTGNCIPGLHYMADVSGKYKKVLRMVEAGEYFAINRPRQYGKTTTINQITHLLQQSGRYLAFKMSFEGVGDKVFEEEAGFTQQFLFWMGKYARLTDAMLADWLDEQAKVCIGLGALSSIITALVKKCGKRVVVMIDEVDKSSNNQLFVSFLGMLRDKYLQRDLYETFHSVILVGVHDVKTLKLKLRPEEEKKFNSPWNIAANFKVDMNLQPGEIKPMLEEYAADRGVTLDAAQIADRLFYYTSGYPFLVSRLCKMLDEEMPDVESRKTWTNGDLDDAVAELVRESNVNFDELVKNIEHNKDLYVLLEDLLINGASFPFDIHDPVTNLGVLYGIFAENKGLSVHNRIYREIIVNYMTMRMLRENRRIPNEFSGTYTLPGDSLDMIRLLEKFQETMKAEYNKKDRDFLERQGRLVFLAFLKPILNGYGHTFKEPQVSEEKRLDVVISFNRYQYVAELKIWRGEKAHEAGLDQLADYLDRLGLDEGFLVVFDHSGVKSWQQKRFLHREKNIFAVWV